MTQQTTSESLGKLAEALSKAQATMQEAKEDSKNPFFKSNYADLTSVWRACRKSLTENGLAVSHSTIFENGEIILVTMLMHSSGEFMKGYFPLMLAKKDAQAVGSAITYAKRYALAAIVGVCVEGEDDDAEKSMDRKELINPQQQVELGKKIEGDRDAVEIILKRFGVKSLGEIPKDNFVTVMNWVETRAKERANGKTRVA